MYSKDVEVADQIKYSGITFESNRYMGKNMRKNHSEGKADPDNYL
jgi:hypothetical protein